MDHPRGRAAHHRRFNATGPALSITMHETLAAIAQGVQVDPKLVSAPTAFLKE
jgi:hypothetical protein